MKKKLRRPMLVRPADALLPAALLAACAAQGREAALKLFAATLAVRLLGLSTAGSLRAAFALQPAMRDVRGSVKCALSLQCVGAALLALGCLACGALTAQSALLVAAGGLLNIEHVFYEYLYSAGDGRSAFISRLVTSALVLAGLALGRNATVSVTCGLSALAACAVALVVGGGLRGRINAQPLRSSPSYLLQDALYPAAFAGLAALNPGNIFGAGILFGGGNFFASFAPLAAPFFAGLLLYSLCRSAFRRSRLEARPMNAALLAALALSVLLGGAGLLFGGSGAIFAALSPVPMYAAALILAAICGFSMFGNIG